MKYTFRVPMAQYAYLELESDNKEDLPEMEQLYNHYSEKSVDFSDGGFEKLTSFTGEEILYNDATHQYKDLDGNLLLSGSAYKKSLDKPFDLEAISKAVGTKHDVEQQVIKDMWSHNGQTSKHFGNAIHWAMEQWFRYKATGEGMEGKEYHLPKHPYLRNVIDTFPLKDENILPEVMVSDVKNKRVGQIDALLATDEKKCKIIDYKSDAKIEDNIKGHFEQLSFYAHILIENGWEVEGLEVWNYTDEWTKYESPVLELK